MLAHGVGTFPDNYVYGKCTYYIWEYGKIGKNNTYLCTDHVPQVYIHCRIPCSTLVQYSLNCSLITHYSTILNFKNQLLAIKGMLASLHCCCPVLLLHHLQLLSLRLLQHRLLAFNSNLGGLARLKHLLPFKWSNLSITSSQTVGVSASFKHCHPKLSRSSVCIMEYCLLIPQGLITAQFAQKTGSSLYTRPQGMRNGQHPCLVLFADYSSDK